MKHKVFLFAALTAFTLSGCGLFKGLFKSGGTSPNNVDTSLINVPEEGGTTFERITNEENDQLIIPYITYNGTRLQWWANPYFAITKDGSKFAYLGSHNGKTNIFVKSLNSRTGSQQRTFNGLAQDFCFSPNGDTICFTQYNAPASNLFLISATQGSIMQQVSSGQTKDYGPAFTEDGKVIFFTRATGNNNYSIWSYNRQTGVFSNFCYGLSPMPIGDQEFLCTRLNSNNNYEIWRVNYVKGTEIIVLNMEDRSFTTPSLSPDGRWILFAANTPHKPNLPENIDIYVVRSDGSQLTQLTYHHGHDLSPVWAPDGKSIYFLSQRGSDEGRYNIWKMNFTL